MVRGFTKNIRDAPISVHAVAYERRYPARTIDLDLSFESSEEQWDQFIPLLPERTRQWHRPGEPTCEALLDKSPGSSDLAF